MTCAFVIMHARMERADWNGETMKTLVETETETRRVWGYRRIARFSGRDGGQCGHLHATADLARACQTAGGCRIVRESCLPSDLHTEVR